MKKKILFASVLSLLILVIAIPGAYAYMIKQTDTVKNVMMPPQLSAQVFSVLPQQATQFTLRFPQIMAHPTAICGTPQVTRM